MVRTENVLVRPVVTEKTVAMKGKYVFVVHGDATKATVKTAVEEFYPGTKVKSINIVNLPAKHRLVGRGRPMRKRAPQKKAIVTVDGTIDFNAFK